MKLITPTQHTQSLGACVYSVAEAAARLGRSESSVRRELRAAGVRRVAGRTVAAVASWEVHPVPVRLPVSIVA